jgi:hypothetical protein
VRLNIANDRITPSEGVVTLALKSVMGIAGSVMTLPLERDTPEINIVAFIGRRI